MMKKLFSTLAAVLLALSATAAPVTPKQATQVARHAVSLYLIEQQTVAKSIADNNSSLTLSNITEQLGMGNIYVFNYQLVDTETQGFVILSGDDIASPVLAISDEGNLDITDMSPATRYWLELYSQQIATAKSQGITATPATALKWIMLQSGVAEQTVLRRKGDFYNDRIDQLLGQMRWGQGKPYNAQCPGSSVTGCVATAFGMIMNYWDYPEHGFGHHSYNGADNPAAYPNWHYGELSANFQDTYYDWEHMEDYAYVNSDEEIKTAISTLLYHVGVSLDMHYTPDGSGCWSLPEYAIFDTSLHLSPNVGAQYRIPRHFGYKYSYAGLRDSVHSDSLWLRMLYNSLAEGKPVYYAGWAARNNEVGFSNTEGHGFILDGYFSDIVDTSFFHINWGWSGQSNGFFKIDAMRPNNSDFTKWHGAIIGLEPDTSYHGYNDAAINPVQISNATVFAQQGRIIVRGAEGESVNLFDIMGRQIASHANRQGSEWSVAVRPGIYVVRLGNQPGVKVTVLD